MRKDCEERNALIEMIMKNLEKADFEEISLIYRFIERFVN